MNSVADVDHIVLSFKDFEIEPYPSCKLDFLSIYHTSQIAENLITTLCGSEIPDDVHVPTGKDVVIYFHSDKTNEFKGFDLTWHKNCGGNLLSDRVKRISFSTLFSQNSKKLFNFMEFFKLFLEFVMIC